MRPSQNKAKISELPKSGWTKINKVGNNTSASDKSTLRILEGENLRKKAVKVKVKTGFASTEGCRVKNPKSIQRVDPRVSIPKIKVTKSSKTNKLYKNQAEFKRKRKL